MHWMQNRLFHQTKRLTKPQNEGDASTAHEIERILT